jgi:heme/copper-type cytochrome/quinol oxidase subunit 2
MCKKVDCIQLQLSYCKIDCIYVIGEKGCLLRSMCNICGMIPRAEEIQIEGVPRDRERRSRQMWDEIIGVMAFIVLFVAGLVIYYFVEKWRERKQRNEHNRSPRERS